MINKWPKEGRLGAENIILGRNKLEDQTKNDCPLLRTVDSIVRGQSPKQKNPGIDDE
jgi:hypothetical protein